MATEYYEVLGIDRSADIDAIQRAYRKRALKLHPDRNKSPDAKDAFMKVAEAYDVLSDVRKKAVYDQYGFGGLQNGVPARDDGFEGFPGGFQFHGDALRVFDQFFGGKNPFQDFFLEREQALDVDNGKRRAFGPKFGGLHGMVQSTQLNKPVKLPPMVHEVDVTLEELYNGSMRKVEVTRRVLNSDAMTTSDRKRLFMMDICKGWRSGTKLTFENEGHQGVNNIPADVVFIINEKPHARFRRKGKNLYHSVDIPLVQALTGSVLRVETLDGRTLHIPVNEVVTPNYEKVIPGEGMPLSRNPSEKGDLVLQFKLSFPKYFNRQQKDLLRQAFDRNGPAAKGIAAPPPGAREEAAGIDEDQAED